MGKRQVSKITGPGNKKRLALKTILLRMKHKKNNPETLMFWLSL